MKLHWKERFHAGGICDFRKMYDFYFKWLLSKTCACFYIKNLPETIDEFYIKSTLIVDGDIGVTDFDAKLYAVNGAPAGQPDEYYVPTQYTVANPVLGSKIFTRGVDGVVIYNTDLDKYVPGGLFGLIDQTATLLADNVISINCNQINTRISAVFTADGEAQAIAGEIALKKMYAGAPYQVLRSDVVDKIGVNPIASSATSQNITELVELNNFIIANYFQSIGVRANNLRKKSHMLQDEIDVQNEYLQISIYEMMSSWQKGFDETNKLYGTDIQVELNPALIDTLLDNDDENETETTTKVESEVEPKVENESTTEPEVETETEPKVEEQTTIEEVKAEEQTVEEIIDVINDNTDDNTDDKEVPEDDSETYRES